MLDKVLVLDVLDEALKTGGDFAEVFFEDSVNNLIGMGNNKVENSASSMVYGVGIRVIKDFFCSYVSTNDVTRNGLLKAAKTAAQAVKDKKRNHAVSFVEQHIFSRHPIIDNPLDIPKIQKREYLEAVSQKAYGLSGKIKRVEASISDKEQNVLIANSEGLWIEDKRIYTSFGLTVIVDENGEQFDDYIRKAGLRGFELIKNANMDEMAEKAVHNAVEQLSAVKCPAGKMPVVVGNEGGVLFHEACGHSLEATSVVKNASVFAGRLGQKIANENITLVDDGTIPNAWGSLNVDDEGFPTQKNVLIKDGVLTGYLVDGFNGRKMGMKPTGSSRRQDYTFMPTSRMNNTFILAGETPVENIISSTKDGLYITKFGGGSVQPQTGDFNFSVSKAYLIENGKVTKPVKGAKLVGNSADVLQNIDMVGHDLNIGGTGRCGSASGWVPVCHGVPTLRIKEITVGGQK
ncbi:MAG: TldD/PmbA family protein [Lactobacillaceae bacterium]|nr:TldD/PmbA family protein [Lactobacillaceae bacterium]